LNRGLNLTVHFATLHAGRMVSDVGSVQGLYKAAATGVAFDGNAGLAGNSLAKPSADWLAV
jgi:hypothetical protein